MSALPPHHHDTMRAISEQAQAPISFAQRWESIHRQSQKLAGLAALGEEQYGGDIAAFPKKAAAASPWLSELVKQSLGDIDALLQPGLTALKTLEERGQDTTAPALTLWCEFHAARSATLALVEDAAHPVKSHAG